MKTEPANVLVAVPNLIDPAEDREVLTLANVTLPAPPMVLVI